MSPSVRTVLAVGPLDRERAVKATAAVWSEAGYDVDAVRGRFSDAVNAAIDRAEREGVHAVVVTAANCRPDPSRTPAELLAHIESERESARDAADARLFQPTGDPAGDPGVWLPGCWLVRDRDGYARLADGYDTPMAAAAFGLELGVTTLPHVVQTHAGPELWRSSWGAIEVERDCRRLARQAFAPTGPACRRDDLSAAASWMLHGVAAAAYGDAWTARLVGSACELARDAGARRVVCVGAGSLFERTAAGLAEGLADDGIEIVGVVDDGRELGSCIGAVQLIDASSASSAGADLALVTAVNGRERLGSIASSVAPCVGVIDQSGASVRFVIDTADVPVSTEAAA